jgi:hypothetical protein
MRRAIAAGLFAFAAAAGGLAVAPPTYEDAFATLGAVVDAGIAGIPDPPATPEEKKGLKAWKAADKASAKALLKPSPKGFTKAGVKIEKVLRKAFPLDAGVGAALSGFSADMVAATTAELQSLQDGIGALPPGDDRDFLLSLLVETEGLLGTAAGAIAPADAHAICARATKVLASVEKKYNKALARAAGSPGMSATVDGSPFATTLVEGTLATDPGTGKVKVLGIVGILFSGTESESLSLGINLVDQATFVEPGTYPVTGLEVEGGYSRMGGGGLVDFVNGEAGTLTIVSVDAARGAVTGFFEFTGPNLAGGTGTVASGRFNATNLVVTDL